MLFVLSFCHKDAELALKNAQWIVTLKNQRQHEVLLVCNKQAEDEGWLKKVYDVFSSAHWDGGSELFTFVPTVEDEREWTPEQRQWPRPQNYLWTQTARYVQRVFNEPWFWLEADASPICDRWLDLLELEYHANKQPFMGMYVATLDHEGKPIPEHMSGVAIYPANIALWSPRMLLSEGTAFDMVGAEVTVHNMHRTQLIHHCYQSPPFMTVSDLDRINPQAVVFHQNKDGSLIDRLIQKRDGITDPVTQQEEYQPSKLGVEGSNPSGVAIEENFAGEWRWRPICDIYIKTWSRDFLWLDYCLKSIANYATGFRQVIIESEKESPLGSAVDYTRWIISPDRHPGYLWQQRCKLYADQHTDADYILYMDSDTIFTREVTPEYFMRGGKPVWLYTMFDKARKDQQVWKPVMHKFVGIEPDREMMRRHPFMVHRDSLENVREFASIQHGMSLEQYIMAQHQEGKMLTFSEWNCMGWAAYNHFPEDFEFMDAEDPNAPECAVWQGYTHGGEERKKSDLEEMKRLLTPKPSEIRVADPPFHAPIQIQTIHTEGIRVTKKGAYDGPAPQATEVSISEQLRGHVTCLKALVEPSKAGRTQMLHAELRKAGLLGPAVKRKAKR